MAQRLAPPPKAAITSSLAPDARTSKLTNDGTFAPDTAASCAWVAALKINASTQLINPSNSTLRMNAWTATWVLGDMVLVFTMCAIVTKARPAVATHKTPTPSPRPPAHHMHRQTRLPNGPQAIHDEKRSTQAQLSAQETDRQPHKKKRLFTGA